MMLVARKRQFLAVREAATITERKRMLAICENVP